MHQGDIDLALQTASAIGDDRLQKEMQGYVVPEAFTHGTSAQRKLWLMTGFNFGQVSACDTMPSEGSNRDTGHSRSEVGVGESAEKSRLSS
jgi:hypothetical protein